MVDSGRYECSVNTLPKISHTVDLEVEDEMAMQDSPAITDFTLFTAGMTSCRPRYRGPRLSMSQKEAQSLYNAGIAFDRASSIDANLPRTFLSKSEKYLLILKSYFASSIED